MATDPVLKPLVDRGLGPNLQGLQRVGDAQSDPGAGPRAAESLMTGSGTQDASSVGGYTPDNAAKYAKFPPILTGLIDQQARAGNGPIQ